MSEACWGEKYFFYRIKREATSAEIKVYVLEQFLTKISLYSLA